MIDFDALRNSEFSWRSALSLCHASQLAYQNSDTVTTQATAWGFEDVTGFEADDTQAFFASRDSVAVLSFRGTESFGDWITNIQLVTDDRPYGRVHHGFFEAFEEVKEQIQSKLSDHALTHLYFTGHSLGGALATVALSEFANADIPHLGGYTYGQPRTGKTDFRNNFDQKHKSVFFRVFNKKDIVPRVPPGYRHVGTRKGLSDDGLLEAIDMESVDADAPPVTEEEFSRLQEGIDSLMATIQAEEEGLESLPLADETLEGFLPGVKAHDLNLYIERLQALAEDEET